MTTRFNLFLCLERIMIKVYKSGEKRKCRYRGSIIPRILQLFCDECGTFAGMPYQSGVKINKIGAVPV
jgi:hypothetical protein